MSEDRKLNLDEWVAVCNLTVSGPIPKKDIRKGDPIPDGLLSDRDFKVLVDNKQIVKRRDLPAEPAVLKTAEAEIHDLREQVAALTHELAELKAVKTKPVKAAKE